MIFAVVDLPFMATVTTIVALLAEPVVFSRFVAVKLPVDVLLSVKPAKLAIEYVIAAPLVSVVSSDVALEV